MFFFSSKVKRPSVPCQSTPHEHTRQRSLLAGAPQMLPMVKSFMLPAPVPQSNRVPLGTTVALVMALMAAVLDAWTGPLSAAQNSEFTIKAKHAIVMDAGSGAVLFQYNADELFTPASMSKLMTAAVVFRALKERKRSLDDELPMSEYAWRTGGAPSRSSAMMVPLNTRTRVSELLRGMIVESGNDAAIALAEGFAGSEIAFSQMMETEARRIGLTKSTFRNATGFFHPEHVMTARELAHLARFLITEYPDRYPMFSEKNFNYRTHKFINRNPLLFMGIGADGLKTGHISHSGYGLVGSAVQEGRRLIVVLAGLASEAERREEGRKMLEWGFHTFGEFKLYEAGETVGKARVWGGDKSSVPLIGNGPVMVVLPRFPANQKLRAEIIYQGPLKSPIKTGDQVAVLRVTSSSDASADVPLFAAEDVVPAGKMKRGLDTIYHFATRWLP
jgi:serine-type D-Ala-D-Ala carboxypeptidase (penicillin-binding protein 5/6)